MSKITITDVRVNPGDAAFLIDDGKTAIMYDSGFAFTGYGVAYKTKNCQIITKVDIFFEKVLTNVCRYGNINKLSARERLRRG